MPEPPDVAEHDPAVEVVVVVPLEVDVEEVVDVGFVDVVGVVAVDEPGRLTTASVFSNSEPAPRHWTFLPLVVIVVDIRADPGRVASGGSAVVDATALSPLRNSVNGGGGPGKCNGRGERVLHDGDDVVTCASE